MKQGGVLSPVLFCVYIDGLLNAVSEAGVGCHMAVLLDIHVTAVIDKCSQTTQALGILRSHVLCIDALYHVHCYG